MEAQPNRVYVIPPNHDLNLLNGVFQLLEPVASHGRRLPIDFFLRALAEDQGDRAAAVILSGTASDGSLGIKMIRQERGLVVVQEPKTAQYDGMPRSAIATKVVDYVLPPQEIPQQLLSYARQADGQRQKRAVESTETEAGNLLQKVFLLLRTKTGHDFSYYKRSTSNRRIERRLLVNQIDDMAAYLRYLQHNPVEVETLFRELLIGVTNFFRDPAAFAVLEEKVIPDLLASTEIGTIFLDNQLRVKGFTPAVARHIKLIAGDIGRPVSDIATNLKYGNLVQEVEQVLVTLTPRELEVSDTQEANWYRMRIMPYRTTDNVVDGVVITFVGITSQKQAESRLRGTTLAAEHDHNLVLQTDTHGRITYVNARLARHTGYTSGELLGQQANIFKTDQTPPETFEELWQTITSGRTWQGEVCNRKKDASTYWEQATIVPELDEQNHVIAFVKVAHDVTLYKQREQELEARLRTLDQRLAGASKDE